MAEQPRTTLPARQKAGQPLIVGAGPVGLTAALKLAQAKHAVRIIDRSPAPNTESRALLMSHHTLALLRDMGLAAKLLGVGHVVRGMNLTINGKAKARLDFDFFPHKLKGLLVVPQNEAERVLADALRETGVLVERHTELVAATMDPQGGDIELRTGNACESCHVSWLIGADGAQSDLRRMLDFELRGSAPASRWSILDLDLGGQADSNRMEICIARGAPTLIRIPMGHGRHRVMGLAGDIRGIIPDRWHPGGIHWQAGFDAVQRLTESRIKGRAAIIGDAAHQNLPLGCRGMNLGIEDAVTLTEIINDAANPEINAPTSGRDEQSRVLFRGWERDRVARTRASLAVSRRMETLVTRPTGWQLFKLPLALRFIGLSPALRREVLSLLTDLRQ
ncbi:MAG: FAD-dependent monooxygenase [Methylobacterium sp.]|nr:FAD-dependent monooxygenase [Methylobacterium sp.]MCA3606608.1 FAD-dependent monooxygenase [Methylobacterium sp.]MCA3608903.1 FAD-dependent monooxygenase [Methylobacterium sp.]MCA3618562.1 FAD-dependent monooxygenase [Methylobacterium sp.]MCA3621896.1 FAD-dependent monooxygenase [Methylobacterium sp.]